MLGLLTLSLDALDALTLLLIVLFLEGLMQFGLLLRLIFSNEVISLLGIFLCDLLLCNLRLLLDFLRVLFLKQLASALKTLLQHAIKFLLLTFLVTVDQTSKVHDVLLMILQESLFFLGTKLIVVLDLCDVLVVTRIDIAIVIDSLLFGHSNLRLIHQFIVKHLLVKLVLLRLHLVDDALEEANVTFRRFFHHFSLLALVRSIVFFIASI